MIVSDEMRDEWFRQDAEKWKRERDEARAAVTVLHGIIADALELYDGECEVEAFDMLRGSITADELAAARASRDKA